MIFQREKIHENEADSTDASDPAKDASDQSAGQEELSATPAAEAGIKIAGKEYWE